MPIVEPSRRADRLRRNRLRSQRGFTLIELIIVIVLMGVLAVVAAPRIFNSNDFNARGFHDETLGLLRFAQKAAIAQRRTVCTTFTGTGATLRIASAAATTGCDTDLSGPKGNTPGTIAARSIVQYSSSPAELRFNGLGQPLDGTGAALAANWTAQVVSAANGITVERETGYVHE